MIFMQNNKIVLCFREGEPFLFNFNTKTFLKLCIDYESTIPCRATDERCRAPCSD